MSFLKKSKISSSVQQVTSDFLIQLDWNQVFRLIVYIDVNTKVQQEYFNVVHKRIKSKNSQVVTHSLHLLDASVQHISNFYRFVASKSLLNTLVKIIEKKNPSVRSDYIIDMIRRWKNLYPTVSLFKLVLNQLEKKRIIFPRPDQIEKIPKFRQSIKNQLRTQLHNKLSKSSSSRPSSNNRKGKNSYSMYGGGSKEIKINNNVSTQRQSRNPMQTTQVNNNNRIVQNNGYFVQKKQISEEQVIKIQKHLFSIQEVTEKLYNILKNWDKNIDINENQEVLKLVNDCRKISVRLLQLSDKYQDHRELLHLILLRIDEIHRALKLFAQITNPKLISKTKSHSKKNTKSKKKSKSKSKSKSKTREKRITLQNNTNKNKNKLNTNGEEEEEEVIEIYNGKNNQENEKDKKNNIFQEKKDFIMEDLLGIELQPTNTSNNNFETVLLEPIKSNEKEKEKEKEKGNFDNLINFDEEQSMNKNNNSDIF